MKKYLVILIVMAVIIIGCATTPPKKKEAAYVPKFDFTPPSSATPGSADVTFALVSAHYSEDQPWTHVWPFTDFSKNMGADFQELLSSRGFTVRGPFNSYEEMTYPEKRGSDLVLTPVLEVSLDVTNIQKEKVFLLDEYKLRGTVIISGRVTLSINESLSNERMWFKSVALPQTPVQWKGEKKYATIPSGVDYRDPGFSRAMGKPMEWFYNEVMKMAWKYLDPEEMRIVKKQAQEIKAKKVY